MKARTRADVPVNNYPKQYQSTMSHLVDGQYADRPSSRFALQRLEPFLRRLASACGSGEHKCVPAAWFYALPDFSPSLNEYRIAEGLPVGGILGWSKARINIVPAAIPINGCGIILARLNGPVRADEILKRFQSGVISKLRIGDKKIILDIGHKNHFLNLYRDDADESYLMLHCSLPEYKADVIASLNQKQVDTPWGPLSCYANREADRFRDSAAMVERLAVAKRNLIFSQLVPDATVLFNQNHVYLFNPTTAVIGCYVSNVPMCNVPLTTTPGGPAYLVNAEVSAPTPIGSLFVQPHGTGNNMKYSGRITFDENSRIFYVENENQDIYDSAIDIFEGYTDLSSVAALFTPWIGPQTRSVFLKPSGQLKLRRADVITSISAEEI